MTPQTSLANFNKNQGLIGPSRVVTLERATIMNLGPGSYFKQNKKKQFEAKIHSRQSKLLST